MLGPINGNRTIRATATRYTHDGVGARLDRLNSAGDRFDKGLRQSLGLMVSYGYDRKAIEHNHAKFVNVNGVTEASTTVRNPVE